MAERRIPSVLVPHREYVFQTCRTKECLTVSLDLVEASKVTECSQYPWITGPATRIRWRKFVELSPELVALYFYGSSGMEMLVFRPPAIGRPVARIQIDLRVNREGTEYRFEDGVLNVPGMIGYKLYVPDLLRISPA